MKRTGKIGEEKSISYSYTTELPGRGFSICQRIIRIINK
jgi:hypothetical protein